MAPDGENPLGDIFHPKARQQCVGLLFQILDHAVASFNYCARFDMSASYACLQVAGTEGRWVHLPVGGHLTGITHSFYTEVDTVACEEYIF